MDINSGHSPDLADLLPAYALGALEGPELQAVEAHLATGCGRCEDELRQLADELEILALSAPPLAAMMPAAAVAESIESLGNVKQRLLANLPARGAGSTPPAAAGGGSGSGAAVVALADRRPAPADAVSTPAPDVAAARRNIRRQWAAIAALLLIALWGVMRQSQLDGEMTQLRGERAQLLARATDLEHRAALAQAETGRLERTMAVMASPGMRSVELAGMGTTHSAAGRAYIDVADHRVVFYGYRLPVLPADKTYELWFVDDEDRNNPAGVFAADARGGATLTLDKPLPVERITGWVVTIEPRGGKPVPTGPIALAG